MSIVAPPKLYLDTNHLINIANACKGALIRDEVSKAYWAIGEHIRSGHVGLIFLPTMALEWVDGNATIESAVEIADMIDSAKLKYEFEADTFVYLHEVVRELKRLDASLCLPEYEIMHVRVIGKSARRAMGVLRCSVPEFFDESESLSDSESMSVDVPFAPACMHVQQSWKFKHEKPAACRERVDGHIAAFTQDLDVFRSRNKMPIRDDDLIGWMKRFLKVDQILTKLNTNVDVDLLLRSVERTRCLAIDLYFKAHEKRIRAANKPDENDSDDWSSVAVVPYADLVLTERRLRSFIVAADPSLDSKVTHDPNQAESFLSDWFKG